MKTFRLILGYLLGLFLFIVLIPYLLVIAANGLDLLLPLTFSCDLRLRLIISSPLCLAGGLFAVWSNVYLFTMGQGGPFDVFNVAISPRSQKLVVNGPYRFCRHPMVFGVLCLYLALSIVLNSPVEFFLILLFQGVAILYLKFYEEKRLLKDFGDEYVRYKATTPMLIPFTKRRKR